MHGLKSKSSVLYATAQLKNFLLIEVFKINFLSLQTADKAPNVGKSMIKDKYSPIGYEKELV